MSNFDTAWLDLREPADSRARDPALLDAAAALAARDERPIITDLGCGTGALLRAFQGRFPEHGRWQLIGADARLLVVARRRAAANTSCDVIEADIDDIDALPLAETSLVAASALLDLVSAEWVARIAGLLGKHVIPFYAALSYDGSMTWSEPSDLDKTIVDAFNSHQRQDKGLGRALGPTAPGVVGHLFQAQGFVVRRADSPWILDAQDADLHRALLRGIADAAAQAGMSADDVAAWLRFREEAAGRSGCRVGHVDLLAVPRSHGYNAADMTQVNT